MIPELQIALAVLVWIVSVCITVAFVGGIVVVICLSAKASKDLSDASDSLKESNSRWLDSRPDTWRYKSKVRITEPINSKADAERVAKDTEERLKRGGATP